MFQLVVVTSSPCWSGFGSAAATEELVKTKRLTLDDLLAALSAFMAPVMLLGMTLSGSGLKETGEATCMTAETPTAQIIN